MYRYMSKIISQSITQSNLSACLRINQASSIDQKSKEKQKTIEHSKDKRKHRKKERIKETEEQRRERIKGSTREERGEGR